MKHWTINSTCPNCNHTITFNFEAPARIKSLTSKFRKQLASKVRMVSTKIEPTTR